MPLLPGIRFWASAVLPPTRAQRKRQVSNARPVVAQPYLNSLEALVGAELTDIPGLVCKHFFSGAALYANTKLCASLTPAGFAFKLPERRCAELIACGKAAHLRYFDKSPIKQGYVLFPDANGLGRATAAGYLKECVAHANAPDA